MFGVLSIFVKCMNHLILHAFQKALFSILHELVVGGQVLEMFDRDETELILGQLAEDIVVKESMPADWSPEQLKELFIKVRGKCPDWRAAS